MLRRSSMGSAVALALLVVGFSGIARADDAACIAASESEATLQKAVKLHEALKQAAICADPSCPVDVKNECSQRIAKMDADMPTVILAATDQNGNDLVAVTVTLDGAPLVTTLDGRAVAIDPGNHVLVFEAQGKPSLEKTVVLRQAEKGRRVDVRLGTSTDALPAPSPEISVSSWSTRKTLALVAGGVGVVGIGVGAGLGASALSSWSTAKNECSTSSCPSSSRGAAESARSSSVTEGDASTVAFVVGAAALAGGVYLWLTAPKGEAPPAPAPQTGLRFLPTFGFGTAGVAMSGRFE